MKIAIIGSGIAGLSAAWLLSPAHDVVVFDMEHHAGGHVRTVNLGGHPPLEAGVQAFHERGYPNLIQLLSHLGIETERSSATFSISSGRGKLEYAIDPITAGKSVSLGSGFVRVLKEMKRFHHEAPQWLESREPNMSLGMYLKNNKYSMEFVRDYILPVAAGMWNVGTTEIRKMPARQLLRAMKMHGFLVPHDQQKWLTVKDGMQSYVDALSAPFKDRIHTDTAILSVYRRKHGIETSDKRGNIGVFDKIIFACGADQALRLLQDATDAEKEMLKSFPYVLSSACLHQDRAFMPKDKAVWRAGNYLHSTRDGKICMTYLLNRLHPSLAAVTKSPYFLTLNPAREPRHKIAEFTYRSPVFTGEALKGWKMLRGIQGKMNTYFCGAWTGLGFHEDALTSGLTVAELIGPNARPWQVSEVSSASVNCRPET